MPDRPEPAWPPSDALFSALVQHLYNPIVVVDAEAHLLYASPATEAFIGLRAADRIGTDVLEFVHPDDHLIAAQAFLTAAETPGVNEALRMRVIDAEGTIKFVEVVSTNLLDHPAVRGILMNIHDLTHAEEVMSAHELTENRYRRMLENISDTVTLIDAEANIISSTGNVKSILGYPTDFWDIRNAFDLVHPDDMSIVQSLFVELLGTPGSEASGEIRVGDAEGGWADIEINAVNLLDDDDVQAIVLTTRNISARKEFEKELAAARDQAVQALQMRTEFIASVSHELRTPIHGILGLSELLATSNLDDEPRRLAQSIGRATESLRMVLDDILDFSKIEVGRLELNRGPVRLRDLADDLVSLFGAQAAAKGIELTVDVEPGFPEWFVGDALRVRQVLTNLVGNSIKFTAVGGVRVEVARIAASVEPMLRVSVRDTGIGIAADAGDRLFEPFSQAHRSTAREFGGTGLGLSIARRLVEMMGGELGYESTLGEGSVFWFTLPLVESDEVLTGASSTPRAPAARPTLGGRVLVVEDNPINQLLVRRQLERLGYDAVVVESGIAALDALSAGTLAVDVVLMDWQLPGIDGLETTRRWRVHEADEGLTPTPIVAMTASALPGDRARCLDAGMDDFLAKPVSMVTLGEVVDRWLGERGRGLDPSSAIGAIGAAAPAGAPAGASIERGGSTNGGGALDTEVLDRLVDELEDRSLVVTVIRTYLRELEGRVTAIENSREIGDANGLVAAAHTLKSTSAAVGARHLAEQCERLERAAAASSAASLPVVAELRSEADAVAAALSAEVSRLEPVS